MVCNFFKYFHFPFLRARYGLGRVLGAPHRLGGFIFRFWRDKVAISYKSPGSDSRVESSSILGAEAPLSTESATLCWEAVVEGASSPLLQFLQRMGAQQLCVRVIAGMAMPPATAVGVLDQFFSGLANKVPCFGSRFNAHVF